MGRRDYTPPPGSIREHSELTERTWSSPILFMEVIANKKATFIERCFREADSKGGFAKAAKTTSRSQLVIERVLAGRRQRTPFINLENKG